MTTSEIPERFWVRVSKPDGESGCWVWTGAKASGYGRVYWQGKVRPAHRITYEAFVGPVSEGLDIDHLCRNRACVNPQHLEPVTHRINLLRGNTIVAAKAQRDECTNGHQFTPENTYLWHGARFCRTCREAVQKGRTRPPRRIIETSCVICGTAFTFERGPGGRAPNTCSEECRTERRRRASKEHARRKRAQVA